MSMKVFWYGLGLFLFSTQVASAAVRINEIAWMGNLNSGSDEWIELYNDAPTAVDLSGWKLTATDGSPTIALSGTIGSRGYFLIERTDDTSVPTIPADLVTSFGDGLGNSGETLVLRDNRSVSVDTVVGGNDWKNVGGDNVTKSTAQRTANSWITGAPTPRATNVAEAGEVLGADASTNAGGALGVSLSDDLHVYTGSTVPLSAVLSGGHATATLRWNFGDGATGEGMQVSHRYDIAGTYVVSVDATRGDAHASDRLVVTVSDPSVLVSAHKEGDRGYVTIENRVDLELDISGWMLTRSDGLRFVFPSHSVIPGKKQFILPNSVSGFIREGGALHLTTADGRTMAGVRSVATGQVAGATMTRPQGVSVPVLPTTTLQNASGTASVLLWGKQNSHAAVGVGGTSVDLRGGMKWAFALFALALIILAGFIIARSNASEATEADQYAIIEDIIESREDLMDAR